MKGLIFTELLEMVEEMLGYGAVNEIIDQANLESQGVYTSVGTYPESELYQLLEVINSKTGISIPTLVHTYGKYLFSKFSVHYKHFFNENTDAFHFLERIEGTIHVEVLKLYPDALLPRIDTERIDQNTMIMKYYSPRKLSELAKGLIEGCADHFDEKILIEEINNEQDGQEVWIKISKV
jgi:hypothetical protein